MQELGSTILNCISVAIKIVTVKIADLVLLPIVYKIQMIQRGIIPCIPVITVVPVLASLFNKVKALIFRLILVTDIRITGTNLHNGFFIICFTVICPCCFPCIILSCNCFKPDVISPVIIAAGETNNHIVSICVIGSAKDILIQNRDNTFNGTGTLICCIGFQFCSDHHNEADRFAVISPGDFIVCRPL